MGKKQKKVNGEMTNAEIYKNWKEAASPPKQFNGEYSRKNFLVDVEQFGSGDYHITLTFAKEPTKEVGRKEFANFIRRVRRLYDKAGVDFRYMYVCEGRRSGTRLHYHLICNSGVSRDDIEAQWKLGIVNSDRLQPDINEGLYALLQYLTKSEGICRKGRKKSR